MSRHTRTVRRDWAAFRGNAEPCGAGEPIDYSNVSWALALADRRNRIEARRNKSRSDKRGAKHPPSFIHVFFLSARYTQAPSRRDSGELPAASLPDPARQSIGRARLK